MARPAAIAEPRTPKALPVTRTAERRSGSASPERVGAQGVKPARSWKERAADRVSRKFGME
jgi:ribosomal protein L15E